MHIGKHNQVEPSSYTSSAPVEFKYTKIYGFRGKKLQGTFQSCYNFIIRKNCIGKWILFGNSKRKKPNDFNEKKLDKKERNKIAIKSGNEISVK